MPRKSMFRKLTFSNNDMVDLSCQKIKEIPKKTYTMRPEVLDLSINNFQVLPAKLSEIKTIKILILTRNELTKWPFVLGAMKKLHEIYMNENHLTKLPGDVDIGGAHTLNISMNQISSLPESFGLLTSLTCLDLSNNNLTNIPDSFGNLSNLKYLYLSSNMLTSLPLSFTDLKKLEQLDLSDNRLSVLQSLNNCISLQELWIHGNNILCLPSLPSCLTILDASNNNLGSLPISISGLKSMKDLWVCQNNITSLPDTICMLSNMRTLGLEQNLLTCLPENIHLLSSLTELRLGRNEIQEFPKNFTALCNLEKLNFEENSLLAIPEDISKMTMLHTLTLSNNLLSSIPASISDMSSLKVLSITGNQISSLPASILKLNLQSLAVAVNQDISVPRFTETSDNPDQVTCLYLPQKMEDSTDIPEDYINSGSDVRHSTHLNDHSVGGNRDDLGDSSSSNSNLGLVVNSSSFNWNTTNCTGTLEAKLHNQNLQKLTESSSVSTVTSGNGSFDSFQNKKHSGPNAGFALDERGSSSHSVELLHHISSSVGQLVDSNGMDVNAYFTASLKNPKTTWNQDDLSDETMC